MATGGTNRIANQALLAAIVESSADAIASITLDGIITSWNSGAEAIYGYTAEEMTGRHVSVLFPPDSTEELEPILAPIRRGRRARPAGSTCGEPSRPKPPGPARRPDDVADRRSGPGAMR